MGLLIIDLFEHASSANLLNPEQFHRYAKPCSIIVHSSIAYDFEQFKLNLLIKIYSYIKQFITQLYYYKIIINDEIFYETIDRNRSYGGEGRSVD